MPGSTWRTHADGSEFAASLAVHAAYDRALRNEDAVMAAAVRATADAYYRSEQDPETVARETAPSDIPGYAEYLAFIAAEGLDGEPETDPASRTRRSRDTHLVSDMASDGAWYGGIGHRVRSTDEGISCYRCGMTAQHAAIQESIPDCQGPESGGNHDYAPDGFGGNECYYECADFTAPCGG